MINRAPTEGSQLLSKLLCGARYERTVRLDSARLQFDATSPARITCRAYLEATFKDDVTIEYRKKNTFTAPIGWKTAAIGREQKVKACWVLLHKVREAMAEELKGRKLGGSGKVAETDGAYFGGYVRPANFKEDRCDRRLFQSQSGKRQSIIIVRERNGNSVLTVFKSEGAP